MLGRVLLVFLSVQSMVYSASQKKGVAHWASNFLCDDFLVLNNMSWWYDWRCNLNYFHINNICTSVIDNYKDTYVPMVWGFYSNTNFSCHVGLNPIALLGPNEPNHEAQSDLSPAEAAAYWPKLEGNSSGLPLVGPSAAPCGSGCNGNTTQWLDSFIGNCTNCRIDFIATHTYWCGVNKTMKFLEMLHNRYNKPIWLTEFACRHKKNKPSRVLTFMQGILPRLESASYIIRYAWYMARILHDDGYIKTSASLFDGNTTTLTDAGQFYQDYSP